MNQEAERRASDSTLLLPVIALPPHSRTFFPKTKAVVNEKLMDWTPVAIDRKMGVLAARAAFNTDKKVLLLHQKTELEEDVEPQPEDLYSVGVVATIVEIYDPEDGTFRMAIETPMRAMVISCTFLDGYLQSSVKIVIEIDATTLIKEAKHAFRRYVKAYPKHYLFEAERDIREIQEPGTLADNITRFIDPPAQKCQEILEEFDSVKRLNCVVNILEENIKLLESRRVFKNIAVQID
ncbi:hypothetical protein C6501_03310 [Candidatus Poribacteria bacterium]|nr:MAG: hypothetical protein C6501_03310 [Candidatus Poribacteria bacterium]